MKKILLSTLLFASVISTLKAQIYTPSGTIQGNSGSNNVGIGTTTPSDPLTIQTNSTANALSIINRISNDDYSNILFKNAAGNAFAGFGNASGRIRIMTGGVGDTFERFTVLANGNVGIGTQSPTAKLDVRGIIKSFEPIGLGSPVSSALLINEVGASAGTGNLIYQRLWLYRDNASSSNWWTTRFHDGISVDGTYATPQTDTRTWWERDPLDNIQSWGIAAETYVTINKGNMGIGTTNPTSKLTVKGDINSREVKVTVDAGADFVFAEDYALPSLDSVDRYIKENKHLPEIASAKEMQTNGINLSEMNIKLLQKLEELTLYVIEQNS